MFAYPKYRGYRQHRNRRNDLEKCERFLQEYNKFNFPDFVDYGYKYEFVTLMRISEDDKAKMARDYGARFDDTSVSLGDDGTIHVIIDAEGEWVNPLLVFDLLLFCYFVSVWVPLFAHTCINFYNKYRSFKQ